MQINLVENTIKPKLHSDFKKAFLNQFFKAQFI